MIINNMGLIDKDTPIKGKVTFAEIVEKAYSHTITKHIQIEDLITKLKEVIEEKKSPTALAMLIPVMKEYLDASITNNDQLVKLAGVLQKLMTANSSNGKDAKELSETLPIEEKKQLLAAIYDIADKASKNNALPPYIPKNTLGVKPS